MAPPLKSLNVNPSRSSPSGDHKTPPCRNPPLRQTSKPLKRRKWSGCAPLACVWANAEPHEQTTFSCSARRGRLRTTVIRQRSGIALGPDLDKPTPPAAASAAVGVKPAPDRCAPNAGTTAVCSAGLEGNEPAQVAWDEKAE